MNTDSYQQIQSEDTGVSQAQTLLHPAQYKSQLHVQAQVQNQTHKQISIFIRTERVFVLVLQSTTLLQAIPVLDSPSMSPMTPIHVYAMYLLLHIC